MTALTTPRPVVPEVSPAANDLDWRIELLWEAATAPASSSEVRGGRLPPALAARFAGRLEIPVRADRPTVMANFVSSLDGAVALDRAGLTGGSEISGRFEPDRFMMGLLRATADAVLVGAGTVRASRTHGWSPGHAHRPSAPLYADWRRELGLGPAGPTSVFVTASGSLDLPEPMGDAGAPIIVATTGAGARQLRDRDLSPSVEVMELDEATDIAGRPAIAPESLIGSLAERGLRLILTEGGPTLFTSLLAAGLVDEIFLTLAPQVVGRSAAAPRLALAEGVAFGLGDAPWARLRSVMRSSDHLFLRYRIPARVREDRP